MTGEGGANERPDRRPVLTTRLSHLHHGLLNGVIIGVERLEAPKHFEVMTNPASDYVLTEEDFLIVIADDVLPEVVPPVPRPPRRG